MSTPIFTPARRRVPRVPASSDVWVYWESLPHRDVSRVKDLSSGGLFLETRLRKREGDLVEVHFLVQEGLIRAAAHVRHAESGRGLGLQLHSVVSRDIPQLDALLSRLRSAVPPM